MYHRDSNIPQSGIGYPPASPVLNSKLELFVLCYEQHHSPLLHEQHHSPLLHWALYFENPGGIGGNYLDASVHDQTGKWQGRPGLVDYCTPKSSRFSGTSRDCKSFFGKYGPCGQTDANNWESFIEIAKATPAPVGDGENCQSWAKSVVSQGCKKGFLPPESIRLVEATPSRIY
jgi:hypothetical protein